MSAQASSVGRGERHIEERGNYADYAFGKRISADRNKPTSAFKKDFGAVVRRSPGKQQKPAGLKDCAVAKPRDGGEYTTDVPTTIGKDTPGYSFAPKKKPARPLDRGEYIDKAATKGALGEYTTPVYSTFKVVEPKKASAAFRPPIKNQVRAAVTPTQQRRNYRDPLKDCAVAKPRDGGEYTTDVPTTIGKDTPGYSFGPKKKPAKPLDRGEYIDKAATKGALGEYTTPVYSSFQAASKPQPARKATTPSRTSAAEHKARLDFAKGHRLSTTTEYTTNVYSSFEAAKGRQSPARTSTMRSSVAQVVRKKKTDWWLGVSNDSGPGPGQYFVP